MKSIFKTFSSTITIFLTTGTIFLSLIYAQTPSIKFDHITIDDGLSQSTVDCILQDSKGFMWFGTQDGLNKYDGYNFTVYKHDPLDSTSISDNYIKCIYEDQSGVLWIGTENGGLNRFNRGQETFENFRHDPADSNSLANNHVWDIVEDNNGFLWIGTWGNGLEKFDIINNRFTHFKYFSGNQLNDDRIRCLYRDHEGILWIGTENGGLSRYNPETKSVENFQHEENNPTSISHMRIRVIWEDSANNLWIGTRLGLNLFDRQTKTFTRFPLLLDWKWTEVTSIIEDDSGNLWIGASDRGICRFDPKTTLYQYFQNNPHDPSSNSSSGVLVLYKDKTNLVWTGTNGGGIDRFNLAPKFNYYTHNSNDKNSLSNASIRAIYEGRDSVLWVGSYGGLDKFDRKTGITKHYRFNKDDLYSLQNNNVYAIEQDPDGSLWIGTEGGGLNHFDPQSEIFTQFVHDNNDPNSLKGEFIFDLFLDNGGDLWIGTDAGLAQLTQENKKNGHFINYSPSPGGSIVNSIFEDKRGSFWIGTEMSGLSRFDRDTETFSNFKYDPNNPNTLSSDRIKCIYQDHSGVVWIGTNGGGLNLYDFANSTFKYYTEKDGLPNDVVYGILEDDNGNLWLSTNRGISKFNPVDETFRNYDVHDGLQSNEFNTGAFYKSWTGEMFFGGIRGLNSFFPDRIPENARVPPIVLTDFLILNESVPLGTWDDGRIILQHHIWETNELSLSYKDKVFSFMFSALSFYAPEKNQYAYKMEGFDSDWIYTDASKRFATYTHLPAGDYTFMVKGSNQDGIWNKAGTSIGITVIPPPWQTWWAYTIYVFAFIFTITGYIGFWTKKQTKELKRHQEIVENLRKIDALKEETLKTQEKYRTIVETSNDLIWTTDLKGMFMFINYRGSEILGHNIEKIIGKDSANFIHPDDLSIARRHFLKVIDKCEAQTCELRIKDKKGEYVTLLVTEVPIYENRDIVGVMAFGLDITERKQAVEALTEKSMYLDNILSSATEYSIATTDLDFRITYYNPMAEKIHGYKAEEVIGKTVQEIHTKEKVAHERFERAIEDIQRYGEHCYIVVKETDEGTRYIDTRVSGIYNSNEELVGYANFGKDITEQKQAEKQLLEYQKQLQSLASELSLAEERERKRIATELHDRIAQSLAFTKIKLGALKEKVSSTDAAHIVGELRETFEQLIQDTRSLTFELASPILYELGLEKAIEWLAEQIHKESGLAIDFKSDEHEKPLTEDVRITLFQAVREVMINVVKHAHAQNITVSVERVANDIQIRMEDDGIGFDVVKTIRPDSRISGFGLFSIRERIKYLGGNFEVDSNPGRGTHITLNAPLHQE